MGEWFIVAQETPPPLPYPAISPGDSRQHPRRQPEMPPHSSCSAGCEEVPECTGRAGDPAGDLSDPSEEHRCSSHTEEGMAWGTRTEYLEGCISVQWEDLGAQPAAQLRLTSWWPDSPVQSQQGCDGEGSRGLHPAQVSGPGAKG